MWDVGSEFYENLNLLAVLSESVPLKGRLSVCKWLLYQKSQRLEPLADSIVFLALVHATYLTVGYDL